MSNEAYKYGPMLEIESQSEETLWQWLVSDTTPEYDDSIWPLAQASTAQERKLHEACHLKIARLFLKKRSAEEREDRLWVGIFRKIKNFF